MNDQFTAPALARAQLQDAMRAVADRLEQSGPDGPADMTNILDVAQSVTGDADQAVLAGMLGLILSPDRGETNGQYAARLRQEVSD
jgi:Flp pilus assembly protein TadG